MTRVAAGLALAVSFLAAPAAGQGGVVLPSGLAVELIEVLYDEDLQLGRFRFLAPALTAEDRTEDLHLLCRGVAVPVMRAQRPDWDEVVVSLSSRALPFGETDPGIIQHFEGYSLSDGDCIWSEY